MEAITRERGAFATAGVEPHRHGPRGLDQLQRRQRADRADHGAAGVANVLQQARRWGGARGGLERREGRKTIRAAPESIQRRPRF